jgi:hypothetical protein
MPIKVKNEDGMIQAIPPSQFERVFQVKYRPKLYFNQKLPKSFLDQCAKYNSTTRTMRPLGALNDYKRKISTPVELRGK